jgi:hypothetical protein
MTSSYLLSTSICESIPVRRGCVIAYTILYISGRDTLTLTTACMMIVRTVLYLDRTRTLLCYIFAVPIAHFQQLHVHTHVAVHTHHRLE